MHDDRNGLSVVRRRPINPLLDFGPLGFDGMLPVSHRLIVSNRYHPTDE
jgi:hypothetical protein